jgi:hypothetical protein
MLSGEQWLTQVFRPAVAGVSRARRERSVGVVSVDPLRMVGGRLAAQVEALGDTGVLTDEQERAALDTLEQAGIMPETRSASAAMSSSVPAGVFAPVPVRTGSAPVVVRESAEPLDPPMLRGVLAGPRQLGQLDGRPVTLISAELWSDRTGPSSARHWPTSPGNYTTSRAPRIAGPAARPNRETVSTGSECNGLLHPLPTPNA